MTFMLLLRRIHMYLALFLAPWMIMYGLSVLFMNHMPFFSKLYGSDWGKFEVEKRMTYDRPLPLREAGGTDAGTTPRIDLDAASQQILQDIGLDGAHWPNASRDGSRITINRNSIVLPRRITYTAADKELVVERQSFQLPMFLRRLHTRRGYGSPYIADDAWALTVDLAIVSMLLWGLTGLWMWYKMKPTRRWGALCAATGCLLFALFVLVI